MVQSNTPQTYIGQPIIRKEDHRFLTRRAAFLDDVKLPGMLHAAFLRSPHAHARLVGIDATEAIPIQGVVAVLTFNDFAEQANPIPVRLYSLPGLEPFLQYPLAQNKVRSSLQRRTVTLSRRRVWPRW